MKVSLKRNIGDAVWVMKDNRPYEGKITKVRYSEFLDNTDYETIRKRLTFNLDNDVHSFEEEYVFDTKDELLASL